MPHSFTRRDALRAMAGAAAVATLTRFSTSQAVAATTTATASRSSSSGSFRHSVCKWCYGKWDLEDFAKQGRSLGLDSIELLGPDEWPIVQKHGLTCGMANGVTTIPDGFNRLDLHAKLVPGMIERIKQCADAGLENVIVFSGNRNGMSDEQGLENCVVGLKQIASAAEKHRVTVCMELLNSRVNHPDYMCDRTPWGVELVKRVGSERIKLLYDIYHMQIMEGDVIRTIQQNHAYIGHYHTAGNPGRNEFGPSDVQELNYPAIMRAIKATGFKGFVGQEFVPTRDPAAALKEAIQICSV